MVLPASRSAPSFLHVHLNFLYFPPQTHPPNLIPLFPSPPCASVRSGDFSDRSGTPHRQHPSHHLRSSNHHSGDSSTLRRRALNHGQSPAAGAAGGQSDEEDTFSFKMQDRKGRVHRFKSGRGGLAALL